MEPGKLTRRNVIQAGAAGTALIGLGGVGRLDAIAEAAGGTPPELRRGTYLPLSGDRFGIGGPEGARSLRLVSVGDLPTPDGVTELGGRDDAFALRFRGSGERLESGIHHLSHPEVGDFRLFLSPIDSSGSTQDYELLVDRTVRVPGAGPSDRELSRLPRPPVRLVTARLRRGRGNRLVAEAEVDSADVEIVRAALLRRGRAVSRALARPRSTGVEIAFAPKARAPSGRYTLRLEIRDRFGNESDARRSLRLR